MEATPTTGVEIDAFVEDERILLLVGLLEENRGRQNVTAASGSASGPSSVQLSDVLGI